MRWNFLSRKTSETKWANILLLVISVLILILVIEGGTRLLISIRYGNSKRGMSSPADYFPHLIYAKKALREKISEQIAPKGANFRVLIIGGSTAEQMPDDLVAKALQPFTEKTIEVINLAHGGYIINQELVMLTLFGMNLDPDLVISIDWVNDIVTTTKTKQPGLEYSVNLVDLAARHPILNAIRQVSFKSQFINSILKLKERKIEKEIQKNTQLIDLTIQCYLQALRNISLITRAKGAQHIAVLQPYLFLRKTITVKEKNTVAKRYQYRHRFLAQTFKDVNHRLSEFQLANGIYYVDATKAFDKTEGEFFRDECHLNSKGKSVFMDYIIKEARGSGFSPKISLFSTPWYEAGKWPFCPVSPIAIPQIIFSHYATKP